MMLSKIPAVPALVRNELVLLQLAIARRADQLARLVVSDPVTDVSLWLQAEEEILARKSDASHKAAKPQSKVVKTTTYHSA